MTVIAMEEAVKPSFPFPSTTRALADTRYNDQTTAASATGIDTLGFDEVQIVLGLNTITAPGTLDVIVMDSSIGTSAVGASAITGAAFDQMALADAPGVFNGRIKTKNTKRYLYVRSIAATASLKEYVVLANQGLNETSRPLTQLTAPQFTV